MTVSYNKDALWLKLEQDINEDFYQEYYPKQSLFHREKVWLEDVRKLNGEIVEKVAKALLEYETKWLGELEEVLRNEERLEWQGQQLLAGKRKKADAAKARKSTLEAQKAVLEKAREHIVEEIRQDGKSGELPPDSQRSVHRTVCRDRAAYSGRPQRAERQSLCAAGTAGGGL